MSYRNTMIAFQLFAAGCTLLLFVVLLTKPAHPRAPRDIVCKSDTKPPAPACVYRKRKAV